MLSFIRRIRKELLARSRMSQYILYALGEFILIVAGILVALQINNWNEGRKERIRERDIAKELFNEVIQNEEYTQRLLEYTQRRLEMTGEFLKITGAEDVSLTMDEFRRLMAGALHFADYSPIVQRAFKITNLDQFTFTRSTSMDQLLSRYLSSVSQVEQYYQYNVDTYKQVILPYLLNHFPSRELDKDFVPQELYSTKYPGDLNKILNDPLFDNILLNIYTDNTGYRSMIEKNLSLIELLKDSLSKAYGF